MGKEDDHEFKSQGGGTLAILAFCPRIAIRPHVAGTMGRCEAKDLPQKGAVGRPNEVWVRRGSHIGQLGDRSSGGVTDCVTP